MGECRDCVNWVLVRKTLYGNGDEVVHYRADPGKGRCGPLGLDTPQDFGCNKFAMVLNDADHIEIVGHKGGAPWQHSRSGPCPDCTGRGSDDPGQPADGEAAPSRGCFRCAGTGMVRHYDDGYIGEERTRLHPKERELAAKPKCVGCGAEVEIAWVACPACGHRLEAVSKTEVVEGLGAAAGIGT